VLPTSQVTSEPLLEATSVRVWTWTRVLKLWQDTRKRKRTGAGQEQETLGAFNNSEATVIALAPAGVKE